MSRTAAVSFVLGLFVAVAAFAAPTDLSAQEPPPAAQAGPGTHTVQPGETLSQIAEARLGSAGAWREIHELNRDRIPDPDRIAPGVVLTLPAGAGVQAQVQAQVMAVQVRGGQAGGAMSTSRSEAPPADYRERRALLERQPFEPRAAPEPDESSRTIFYGSPTRGMQREGYSQVLLLPESDVPVVQPGAARSAGWIVAEESELEVLGEILRFATVRSLPIREATLLPGDEVIVRVAAGTSLRPGDRVTTVRPPRAVEGLGAVVVPTGEVELRFLDGEEAVFRVTQAWDPVRLGQLLVIPHVADLPVGIRPREATREMGAEVLAFEDAKELYLVGDRLFIDRGTADGIAIGDVFVAMVGGADASAARASASASGASMAGGSMAGEFQVVRVQEGVATLRITRTVEPRQIRIGTRLHLLAEMP